MIIDFSEAPEKVKHIAVYKVLKSFYKTSKGFASKIDLVKMKRLSSGWDGLEDMHDNIGGEYDLIINLDEVSHNELYYVKAVDLSQDWETGLIDDWNLKLLPYKEEGL